MNRPEAVAGIPRLAPGERGEVGLVAWTIATVAGRVAGTSPPNLFLTLGRHRRLFRGWLRFASTLMPRGRLPRRESELVILRVAHQLGCTYEFDHHVRLGRRAGVTDADLARLTSPDAGDRDKWSAREGAVLNAVDQLLEREDLDDAHWDGVAAHLDDRELLELVLLVGHYRMLATAITVVRIQPDSPRG